MSLLPFFRPYIDKYGLSSLSTKDGKGETTQNGVLFTMQYLICLIENEDARKDVEIERIKVAFKNCEAYQGLSCRFPSSPEIDSMDNQAALLTFSALYDDGRYANDMYLYGQNTRCPLPPEADEKTTKIYKLARWVFNLGFTPKNVWNVEKPGTFHINAWWGRSPSLLGLSRMTSNRFCNPFLWLGVMVGQFVGAFKPVEDCDARTLPFIVWHYLKTRSFIWRAAYKLWYYLLKRKYPNGMQDVYRRYYGDKGHPLIEYTKS